MKFCIIWAQVDILSWQVFFWLFAQPPFFSTNRASRRGRVGSGQGNPRISSVAVLSQAERSESTQNHFESFWVGISESHGLEHWWAVTNTMLSAIWQLILNVLYLCCFNFSCDFHVSLKSLPFWSAICHFTCLFWVNLSYSPRGNMTFYVFILSCFESFSPSQNLIMNRITEPPKNTWPCPTLPCILLWWFWTRDTCRITSFRWRINQSLKGDYKKDGKIDPTTKVKTQFVPERGNDVVDDQIWCHWGLFFSPLHRRPCCYRKAQIWTLRCYLEGHDFAPKSKGSNMETRRL